jgi:hypothetical protein
MGLIERAIGRVGVLRSSGRRQSKMIGRYDICQTSALNIALLAWGIAEIISDEGV